MVEVVTKPTDRAAFPLQGRARSRPTAYASVNRAVYLRIYEVYSEVYGSQQALVEDGCRGGFGVGEAIAFLYASGFPRKEWRARVDEALKGMDVS